MKVLVCAFNQENALIGAVSVIVKTDGSFAALTEILDTLGGGSRCVSRAPGVGQPTWKLLKLCVLVWLFAAVCLCVTNAVHHLGAAIWCHHLSLPH